MLTVEQWSVFRRGPEGGNPCPVVALWELCRRQHATGAYIFAPHGDGQPDHVVARQFPVDAGCPEERPPLPGLHSAGPAAA